jgi:hypothetical protein
VDADVPVDAKNASTSDFENCRQFSTAPTPNLFFFKEKKEERRTDERKNRNPTVHGIGSPPFLACD